MSPSEVMERASDDRLAAILQASHDEPVLVYFTAPWCVPCRQYGPVLEAYFARSPHRQGYVVDGDDSPAFLDHFGVRGYPTTVVLRDGQIGWKHSSAMAASKLGPALDTAFDSLSVSTEGTESADTTASGPVTLVVPDDLPQGSLTNFRTTGGPIQVGAGELITVDPADRLILAVSADERRSAEPDIAFLPGLTDLTFMTVVIKARHISVDFVERLVTNLRVNSLQIQTDEPIPVKALELLATSDARELELNAPGLDPDQLAGTYLGRSFNGIVRARAFDAPTLAEVTWTDVSNLADLIASEGEETLVFVQPQHPAAATAARTWIAQSLGTVVVSAYGKPELLRTLAMDSGAPVIIRIAGGSVKWRLELPELIDGTELARFVAEADSATAEETAALPAWSFAPERTIANMAVSLVPEGKVTSGAVLNSDDNTELIPAGWRVTSWVQVHDEFAADSAVVDGLTLQYLPRVAADFTRLTQLTSISALAIAADEMDSQQVQNLSGLRSIISLRLHRGTQSHREALALARPDLILDGVWPARLAVTAAQRGLIPDRPL